MEENHGGRYVGTSPGGGRGVCVCLCVCVHVCMPKIKEGVGEIVLR